MTERRGEKVGWLGGWFGAFIWLLLLSIIRMIQGKNGSALAGIGLFAVAVGLIFLCRPWKHPNTRYWKLMLPVYAIFFISVAIHLPIFGDPAKAGLNWNSLIYLIPCLIPFFTMGKRKWDNSG